MSKEEAAIWLDGFTSGMAFGSGVGINGFHERHSPQMAEIITQLRDAQLAAAVHPADSGPINGG